MSNVRVSFCPKGGTGGMLGFELMIWVGMGPLSGLFPRV